jgi:hypothetical protein
VSRDVVKVAAHGIDLGLISRRAAELVQVHAIGAAADGAEVAGAGHLALVERGLEAADVELVAAPTLAACEETRTMRSVVVVQHSSRGAKGDAERKCYLPYSRPM